MIGLESMLKILSAVGGVIKWVEDKIKKRAKKNSAQITVPKKSLIILPSQYKNSLWWHLGSKSGHPAMQISGAVRVTNITTYKVYPTVKLKERTTMDMFTIKIGLRGPGMDFIPPASTVDLDFHCFIEVPVKKEPEFFVTDVGVVDQFGNEHWLKKVEFEYR